MINEFFFLKKSGGLPCVVRVDEDTISLGLTPDWVQGSKVGQPRTVLPRYAPHNSRQF
jgi:hypothetical protein